VSVPAALATTAAKAQAAARGAAAADMESAAVAAVAEQARVPFVALRVVVDTAADALPGDPERWIDERGERRLTPTLAAAFKPAQWRALLVLAWRYRAACGALERLAAVVGSSGFCLPERR
jgi:adenosylhomocysteine nucleosidase